MIFDAQWQIMRVAEVAKVYLEKYDEVGNPALGNGIAWRMAEIQKRLDLTRITGKAVYRSQYDRRICHLWFP